MNLLLPTSPTTAPCLGSPPTPLCAPDTVASYQSFDILILSQAQGFLVVPGMILLHSFLLWLHWGHCSDGLYLEVRSLTPLYKMTPPATTFPLNPDDGSFYVSTCLGQGGAEIFGQALFWVFLWGCFGMKLTFKSLYWVKQTALPNVGGHHPISWRPEQNKRLSLRQVREDSQAYWQRERERKGEGKRNLLSVLFLWKTLTNTTCLVFPTAPITIWYTVSFWVYLFIAYPPHVSSWGRELCFILCCISTAQHIVDAQ